jgi:hypothetical protein
MSNFVSLGGKMYAAEEYYVNGKAPEGVDPIYKGPDRAAMKSIMKEKALPGETWEELVERGEHYIGFDGRENDDMLLRARELGFDSVEDYLKMRKKIDFEEMVKKQAESLVGRERVKHKNPERHSSSLEYNSGGADTSGQGNHIKGGFDDPMGVSSNQLNKRA